MEINRPRMANRIKATLAVGLAVLFSVLLAFSEEADAASLLQLDELSVNYKKFFSSSRDPLFTGLPPKEEINLHVNMNLAGPLYWDNIVHAMTDDAQYRVVGWNLKLGIRLSPYLDIQYEHFSRHLLDTTYPHAKFPVEDSLGFKLYIYRAEPKKSRPSVLGAFE